MHLLSVKSVESPKVVWTGFHYLPWLAQNFEGVGGMSSLLILDVYGASQLLMLLLLMPRSFFPDMRTTQHKQAVLKLVLSPLISLLLINVLSSILQTLPIDEPAI